MKLASQWSYVQNFPDKAFLSAVYKVVLQFCPRLSGNDKPLERRWWILGFIAFLVAYELCTMKKEFGANSRSSLYENPSLEGCDEFDIRENSGSVP